MKLLNRRDDNLHDTKTAEPTSATAKLKVMAKKILLLTVK